MALHLVAIRDRRKIVEQAAFRRALSSSYYAVFHTLCAVGAEGLGFRSAPSEDIEPIYRSLEHRKAQDVLASPKTRQLHEDLARIGSAFIELRQLREDADYSQPGRFGSQQRLLTRNETKTLIDLADETIRILDALPIDIRRKLAVALLVRPSRR
ncbi:hypothetical protein [Methylobacterium trifolii]|uniref:hypothetical protein n=1 Tax=Methylobacterium trifolii TaxID=1003092 RepID=UPI001EE13B2B|nr:hypothetical protein [Methylobacterium trifolii]